MNKRNFVAKHCGINKASVHKDRKRLSKCGQRKQKHKGGYGRDSVAVFLWEFVGAATNIGKHGGLSLSDNLFRRFFE